MVNNLQRMSYIFEIVLDCSRNPITHPQHGANLLGHCEHVCRVHLVGQSFQFVLGAAQYFRVCDVNGISKGRLRSFLVVVKQTTYNTEIWILFLMSMSPLSLPPHSGTHTAQLLSSSAMASSPDQTDTFFHYRKSYFSLTSFHFFNHSMEYIYLF